MELIETFNLSAASETPLQKTFKDVSLSNISICFFLLPILLVLLVLLVLLLLSDLLNLVKAKLYRGLATED